MPLSQSNIISDIMQGASEVEQYNQAGVATFIKLDRVFLINGMNQYSSKRQAMNDAKALIKTLYPIGVPNPSNPLAKARAYAAQPTQSDDVVQVVLSYLYTEIGITATQWQIEVTSFLEMVPTDAEYAVNDDNNTKILNGIASNAAGPGAGAIITQAGYRPIQVVYHPEWQIGQEWPGAAKADGTYQTSNGSTPGAVPINPGVLYEVPSAPLVSFAQCSVLRPRKRIVFSRTVYGDAITQKIEAAADQYEGYLNSVAFRGRPPGTVICMNVGVRYNPYFGSNSAMLEFVSRPAIEGWQPWVRYSNPLFGGTPPNVFRWTPSGKSGNGIRRSYQYLGADFNRLLALLPGGVVGDSPNSIAAGGVIVNSVPNPNQPGGGGFTGIGQ